MENPESFLWHALLLHSSRARAPEVQALACNTFTATADEKCQTVYTFALLSGKKYSLTSSSEIHEYFGNIKSSIH